jgi:hypothetical protein
LTLLPILRDEVSPAKHLKRPGPEALPAVLDATTAARRLMMNLQASIRRGEWEVSGERSRYTLAHLKAQSKHCC